MLTATYALISLSVEQKKAHNLLSTVQQLFQNSSADRQRIDPAILESVVSQFTKLDESCHRRKVEVYVIPAIQKATKEADPLLAELESLSAGGAALSQIGQRTGAASFQSRGDRSKGIVFIHRTLLQ